MPTATAEPTRTGTRKRGRPAVPRRQGPEETAAQGEGRAPCRVQIAVATSPAYREWAEGLAKSLRLPLSLAVDHGLAALAERANYPAPPPRRA